MDKHQKQPVSNTPAAASGDDQASTRGSGVLCTLYVAAKLKQDYLAAAAAFAAAAAKLEQDSLSVVVAINHQSEEMVSVAAKH